MERSTKHVNVKLNETFKYVTRNVKFLVYRHKLAPSDRTLLNKSKNFNVSVNKFSVLVKKLAQLVNHILYNAKL